MNKRQRLLRACVMLSFGGVLLSVILGVVLLWDGSVYTGQMLLPMFLLLFFMVAGFITLKLYQISDSMDSL